MRVFKAFLVIMASVILFILPLTTSMYDFKTDRQEDQFDVDTGVGETSENVTLSEFIYDDDSTTVELSSDLSTDAPTNSSYNATAHSLLVGGLTANTTRTLTVWYDIDALSGSDAINNLSDRMAWIWLITVIAFAPAALAAIFLGKAD